MPASMDRESRLARSGFALFVVILMVAILAVASTVITVTLASTNSRNRAQQALDELSQYRARGQQFRILYGGGTSNAFQEAPGRLSAMTAPIIRPANCTGVYCELNTCQEAQFEDTDVALWNSSATNFGPFLTHRVIEKHYGYPLPGGFGFVSDTIYRASAPPTKLVTDASGEAQAVWVNIHFVESVDALELDVIADAGNGAAAGIVRWGTVTNGQVVVNYQIAPAGTAAPGWAGC